MAKTGEKSMGKCPVMHGGDHRRRKVEYGMVARSAEPRHPPSARHQDQSDGKGLQLSGRGQEAGRRGAQERPARADDGQPGMVAGGLGTLWRPDDPHVLACRGVVSNSPTAAAAAAPAISGSRRSTPGRTTSASTRRAACCGRSRRNTATRSAGPI